MRKAIREGDMFVNIAGVLSIFLVGDYPIRSDGYINGWFLHRHDDRWTAVRGRLIHDEVREVEQDGAQWHRHLCNNRTSELLGDR